METTSTACSGGHCHTTDWFAPLYAVTSNSRLQRLLLAVLEQAFSSKHHFNLKPKFEGLFMIRASHVKMNQRYEIHFLRSTKVICTTSVDSVWVLSFHCITIFVFARLGQYEAWRFLGIRVKLALRKFQRAIQKIGAELEQQ